MWQIDRLYVYKGLEIKKRVLHLKKPERLLLSRYLELVEHLKSHRTPPSRWQIRQLKPGYATPNRMDFLANTVLVYARASPWGTYISSWWKCPGIDQNGVCWCDATQCCLYLLQFSLVPLGGNYRLFDRSMKKNHETLQERSNNFHEKIGKS